MQLSFQNSSVIYFKILYIGIISFIALNSQAQNLSAAQIKTGLIFKFTQNLKWNLTKSPDSFQIFIIGEDRELVYELDKLSKLKKINNLSISVQKLKHLDNVVAPFPQILIVGQEYNFNIKQIYRKIASSNCLLITTNCRENQYVMINFTEDKQKVNFEVNRITLFGQKIDVSSKLVLLGGKDIDLFDLYYDLEKKLDSAQQNLKHQQQFLEEQSFELEKRKREINESKKDVVLLQSQIMQQKDNLKKLTTSISVQELILNQKMDLLNIQKMAIIKQENEIDKQRKAISDQKEILDSQLKDIYQNKKIIEQQIETLTSQTDTIKNQKSTIHISIIIIVIFAVLILTIFYLFRNKQKINNRLNEKNIEVLQQKHRIEKQAEALNLTNNELQTSQEEIKNQSEILKKMNFDLSSQTSILQEKNKQINASLRYAQTIQNAILPPKKHKGKNSEYFVIYKPREIVSGDFFWFSEIYDNNTKNIFASVIDCTGHGVPGAFMAMIGNRILNETILEKKIYDPSDILETMHTVVKTTLKQDESNNTDGMDMSIIRAVKQNKITKITFSGAKQTFYILKKKTGEVLRIRGDVKAIGGIYYDHVQFTSKTFELELGDIVFLLSDGIIDQNGESKKRFGSLNLIALIKELHTISFDLQQAYIESYLKGYMKSIEQRDDITLMAIKF